MNALTEIRTLCDEVAAMPDTGEGGAEEIAGLRSRLDEPVRLAIAGRVKAGKSTLLNALVGERLAPTDAGECTRIVTWYRNDVTYRVTARMTNGDSRELPFDRAGGELAVSLEGLAEADVDHLIVGWPSARLANLTLVDTPGIGSLSPEAGARTEAMFAAGEVDAVVYLMRHLHPADTGFLEAFGDGLDLGAAAVVLSRADEIAGARPDSLDVASRVAEGYASDPRIRSVADSVIPLAGLLAETGRTVHEQEAAELRTVAAMPARELRLRLVSADRFVGIDDDPDRATLLARLGLFGVRHVVGHLTGHPAASAQKLAALLVAASGIVDLETVIGERFTRHADALKIRSTLEGLRRISSGLSAEGAQRIERETERIEAAAIELAVMRLAAAVRLPELHLSSEERSEVDGLVTDGTGQDPGPRIEYWRTRALHPLAGGLEREVCDLVVRIYEFRLAGS